MDNNNWDREKLNNWKTFWESEMGKVALGRMEDYQNSCLERAFKEVDPARIQYYIGRAAGADEIINDIMQIVKNAETVSKEAQM